ncbi:unnamed protein product [Arabis nemorensis]|uniref:Uncharacterized protein n=1 Tax=Arabis nemorensis TaxID=586526 RepID=A0A565C4U5_9BRAS|nr:unnamed protein product [Arabis nemorensis]
MAFCEIDVDDETIDDKKKEDLDHNVQLFLGIIICIMSLHMYFAPPQTLVDLPVTHETHPKTLKQVTVEAKTDS